MSTVSSHLICRSARLRHMLTALSMQCTPSTESLLSLRLWRGRGRQPSAGAEVPSSRQLQAPPPGSAAGWLSLLGCPGSLTRGIPAHVDEPRDTRPCPTQRIKFSSWSHQNQLTAFTSLSLSFLACKMTIILSTLNKWGNSLRGVELLSQGHKALKATK